MKTTSLRLGIALLAAAALTECAATAQGQSEKIRVTEVGYKKQGMIHKAKEGMRDTTDAMHITPKVKAAIIEDSQLNDKRNHINVRTKDYVLHLTGHVYSKAVKMRAGSVAAAKLSKMHKGYKVSNELSISH